MWWVKLSGGFGVCYCLVFDVFGLLLCCVWMWAVLGGLGMLCFRVLGLGFSGLGDGFGSGWIALWFIYVFCRFEIGGLVVYLWVECLVGCIMVAS